ncbi:hypothetical protein HN51_059987 [Arachis hypogaea]|uniref:Uncharacterized protein n=1 Tax=Arachis hypogaea TaxID=3818 RepID=A0A444X809_ARAHY|nr:guanine nucleotide-binding protein subunit beta-2-like 1 isoform X1 [Arachis ipaensis]XP_025682703.1 guanine nucleotide-binding protein subunit beta-2-like 1 [Arachis hypogaea]QHN83521.1 uncharacterized protein DS421_20g705470 [Arachis hypogaea]RYQ85830.1 hypothetical protein Ahy_B10g105449 [Arachis hypogaea]
MSASSPPTQPPTTPPTPTSLIDLDVDSLSHCLAHLSVRDVSALAMTCTSLKRLTYSDSVWLRFFREHWHLEVPWSSLNTLGARDLYLARRSALLQFKFLHPVSLQVYRHTSSRSNFNHLLLDKNHIFSARGSTVEMIDLDRDDPGSEDANLLFSGHRARITCMRLFPLNGVFTSCGETEGEQKFLVTSSYDHSIRLWGKKGSCLRCMRGHHGPVLSLSDKLLGDDTCKVLASGGEDGTVRLWSLSSSGKQRQQSLKATLYGHEKPVELMLVAGHKTSLLVTISRDAKVRVWDTTTSSSARSSCCVGMTTLRGAPVNMKCHESLLYVAAGSSVTAVDLRTMQKVMTAAVHQPKLYSFDIVPSKSLLCTGGDGRAMLWDIRRNQEAWNPDPVAELDGHCGQVTLLHMDPYKVVTGGPHDEYVNVWESDTGVHVNSLFCCNDEKEVPKFGCDTMAVDGLRIVTATICDDATILRYRDFTYATNPVAKPENDPPSKFWFSLSGDYSDDNNS